MEVKLHKFVRLVPLAAAVFLLAAVIMGPAATRMAEGPVEAGSEEAGERVEIEIDLPSSEDEEGESQIPSALPDYQPRARGYDIFVEKSSRRMTVFVSGRSYRTYRIYLGFTPEGHKTRRGDGRTPEGTYYVSRRNSASAYYRSLLISYPSPEDARVGVQSGIVGTSVLNAVISAHRRAVTPPQDTRLGGNICIHGEGNRRRPAEDWTAGCIAITNKEMAEIFSLIPVGTPVTIRP